MGGGELIAWEGATIIPSHALADDYFQATRQKRYSVFTLKTGNEAMTGGTDISVLYEEFTDALTEVLAENSVVPPRRGRLARARAAAKKHPKYTEHEYFLAVETAFTRWELIQNTGR